MYYYYYYREFNCVLWWARSALHNTNVWANHAYDFIAIL